RRRGWSSIWRLDVRGADARVDRQLCESRQEQGRRDRSSGGLRLHRTDRVEKMTAELHQFPSKSPEPEAERMSAIVAAFDALTDAERSIRYQRRRLFAETNNSGNADGAFAALQSLGANPGPIDETTYRTDKAAFEAALAVCVADGASPTQAHVTSANNAYTTF